MNDAALHPASAIPRIEIPSLRDLLRGVQGKLREVGLVMAGFSDAQEIEILDSIFGDHGSIQLNATPTYLALTTSAVGESDTGATLVEATYTGYARKAVAATDMNPAAAGSKNNVNALVFAGCTAGTSTIIGWAVATTSGTGTGKVIVFGTCTSTVISTTQTPAQIAAAGLVVNLD